MGAAIKRDILQRDISDFSILQGMVWDWTYTRLRESGEQM